MKLIWLALVCASASAVALHQDPAGSESTAASKDCGSANCGMVSEHGAALHGYEEDLDRSVKSPEHEAEAIVEASVNGLQDELNHLDEPSGTTELDSAEAAIDARDAKAGRDAAAEQVPGCGIQITESQAQDEADKDAQMEAGVDAQSAQQAALDREEDAIDQAGAEAEAQLNQEAAPKKR
eukprot:TRINITY_DN21726_c0_g1_i2.p1 TRINITY_DN21726_c0_g1~~TRINITY_DN21726_c0_g1_i2.p1  ORF type:complete len:181 (-),score=52.80 TRINITY_DN21726_c0_g1_i2:256-798(-)